MMKMQGVNTCFYVIDCIKNDDGFYMNLSFGNDLYLPN